MGPLGLFHKPAGIWREDEKNFLVTVQKQVENNKTQTKKEKNT